MNLLKQVSMKKLLLALVLGSSLVPTAFLWSQTHPQEPPAEVCFTNHRNPEHRCDCVKQDEGAGCKDGKRDVEMATCKSFCWKDKCACCAT